MQQPNLLDMATPPQIARLQRAALAQARRRAQPSACAHEVLQLAACNTFEILDSRLERQQARLWQALMQA